jgi:hypothetical protein
MTPELGDVTGAVQVRLIVIVVSPVTDSPVGAAVRVAAVNEADGADAPYPSDASTSKQYAVPTVSPVTV